MKNISLWTDTETPPDVSPLKGEIKVDVVVIGAGITGLSAAYLLQKGGCRVAVVDQQGVAQGETAHTTAHVTHVTDSRLYQLCDSLGEDAARGLWDAGRFAMEQIQELKRDLQIDCDLREVPGYLFAALGKDTDEESKSLRRDAEFAGRFGFDAAFFDQDPLYSRPAVRFANQLKFHPLKYVAALARAFQAAGGQIFGKTCVNEVDAEKREIRAGGGRILYNTLVAATHVPIQGERGVLGAALFQTKLAAYSTYAIEAEIEPVPEALYWDTSDPYLYLRFDRNAGKTSVIIGGEDHKTGQEPDPEARYQKLEAALRYKFPSARPRRRWSGQVIETPDGLPYIGEVSAHQFVATGFSGNGMTLGTYGAMLIRDLILGNKNPWSLLFDPHRKVVAGGWEYLKENKDFAIHFFKDRLAPAEKLEEVANDSGAIVRIDGKKCAVYRDKQGRKTTLSPVCPHMGCIVAWNDAEKTWDCPCHGSRFTATGDLIAGPAESGLEKAEAK